MLDPILGAVATPHFSATAAAEDVLTNGGNAIDAALAAAAALTVVYPNQCSIGGDAIALVGKADGTVTSINGTGRAPARMDVARMREEFTHMPVTGPHSVTVPGVLSVWEEMSSTWGQRPLSGALQHAADLAEAGVPVAPGVARDLAMEEVALARDEGARNLFFQGGHVLTAGATMKNIRLAETLRTLAVSGTEAFYNGEIGESLVAALSQKGSYLTQSDFESHSVSTDPAHSIDFQGDTYFSTGINSQGIYFLQELGALERIAEELNSVPNPLGEHAAIVAKVLNEAAVARDKYLGDPSTSQQTLEDVLGADVLQGIAGRALSTAKHSPGMADTTIPAGNGDTVAIVAADASGHWVSLIQSAFHAFGSTIVDPRTGILLHNRGASFVLTPGAANALSPGCRPPHTLMPVLSSRDNKLVGAHGTMGGRAQPQIHAHLALQLAMSPDPLNAVSASRWVLGQLEAGPRPENDDVFVSYEDGASQEALNSLQTAGFELNSIGTNSDEAGHTQIVRRDEETGLLIAASDPRADGKAATTDTQD